MFEKNVGDAARIREFVVAGGRVAGRAELRIATAEAPHEYPRGRMWVGLAVGDGGDDLPLAVGAELWCDYAQVVALLGGDDGWDFAARNLRVA